MHPRAAGTMVVARRAHVLVAVLLVSVVGFAPPFFLVLSWETISLDYAWTSRVNSSSSGGSNSSGYRMLYWEIPTDMTPRDMTGKPTLFDGDIPTSTSTSTPTSKPTSKPTSEPNGILYFIKTCKRFEKRALGLQRSWGHHVNNIVYSTEQTLSVIPRNLQVVQPVSDYLKHRILTTANSSAVYDGVSGVAVHRLAESCVTAILNLRKVLMDARFRNVSWLFISDDDTFVIENNLKSYLATFHPQTEDYYVGLSASAILGWYPTARNGYRSMAIASTAPGVLYSRHLLERMRARADELFTQEESVFQMCKRAQYTDDITLGLLAIVDFKTPMINRPDLFGFHFRHVPDPQNIAPLTIHTEQKEFEQDGYDRMQRLAMQYYGHGDRPQDRIHI